MEQYADDGPRFAEPDLQFHQLILRMTGNELIGSLAALIEAALVMSFRLSDANPLGQRPLPAAAPPGDRLHQGPRLRTARVMRC